MTSAEQMPLVAVYADESCLGNGREGNNPGGAAGLIEYFNAATERLSRFDYWISEPATTNNRMALRSAIEAMRVLSRKGTRFRVCFTSDSQYLVKGGSEWLYGWISRGWRRKEGAIENVELWKQLVAAVNDGGHRMMWRWVRGHKGHLQNEYANFLAIRAAREQTSSEGAVTSSFDAWLAEERAKGRLAGEPEEFPQSQAFRGSRPFPNGGTASLVF